ncbi:NfeD family protein [Gryllotalpicola ginsengisoli]|uniref:NfeD family protein n=1 Tax=Gryllotalpicola ginsengisoli TaxID=444608 RepID=UPI0003B5090A|nr:NfeD family protein [Gryllotalpicola ginsengisoli]
MGGYEWIIWAGLVILFAVIEMVAGEFTFMMLALGSLAGLVAELAGAPWWLAFLIAAAVAVLGIFLLRPPLLRRLRRGADPAKSNIDAIIGSTGRVTLAVTGTGGQVKLVNGETWSARLAPDHPGDLAPGTEVRVVAVDGASVVIEASHDAVRGKQ